MAVLDWFVIAAAAGIGLVAVVVGVGRSGERGAPAGHLRDTRMQRLARRSLGAGILISVVLVSWVLYFGADRTQSDTAFRVAFELGLVAIFVVFAVMTARIGAWVRREDGTVDERDLRILRRSHEVTSVRSC